MPFETTDGDRAEPLALVGLACRYPGGADDETAFWKMLREGRDGYGPTPVERWHADRFENGVDGVAGRIGNSCAAFLKDFDYRSLDDAFFGLSPREAEVLDPQQRLMMEVAWEALEDSGLGALRWSGRRVGVYVGAFTLDHYVLNLAHDARTSLTPYSATGATLVMLSNRLSYVFDFHGPSLTIDTACSSSLVAFNYACRDLWAGRVEMAVVGGVNVMLNPSISAGMSRGGFLAADGRSKSFDSRADGYGRGEGCGAVVLRRLADVRADGQNVRALVRGTGVNQDGRTAGIAFPNGDAQETLIRDVFAEFQLDPARVILVEAHGTGTAVGDPIEISALGRALGQPAGGVRIVGSVKANIGHQEAGAGVASIIKSVLAMENRTAPPQAGLEQVNAALDMDGGGFVVAREATALADLSDPESLVCVNSFGYGGTNAHVVLSPAPQVSDSVSEHPLTSVRPLVLSARDDIALAARAGRMADLLDADSGGDVDGMAFALAGRSTHLERRAAVVVHDRTEANERLRDLAANREDGAWIKGVLQQDATGEFGNGTVWIYTGMGPQWRGMGCQLMNEVPVFADALRAAEAAFMDAGGPSILTEMTGDGDPSRLSRNEIAQPANFLLQYGLTRLLDSLGVHPAAIMGHSVGEIAAAVAAEALSLEDAARITFHRSRLQQRQAGRGRMLATGLSLEMAEDVVRLYPGRLSVGAINASESIVLSGDAEALAEVESVLEAEGVFHRLVFGEVAYHSHQMDGLHDEFVDCLAGLRPRPPKVPLYSTVTGARVDGAIQDVSYWWRNVREPVRFAAAFGNVSADGARFFLEVGPHPVLRPAIAQITGGAMPVVGHSLIREKPEAETLLGGLLGLWARGAAIDPCRLTPVPSDGIQRLPPYPWNRRKRFSFPSEIGDQLRRPDDHPLLGWRRAWDPGWSWGQVIGGAWCRQLADHAVGGKATMPGAAYVDCFLAAMRLTDAQGDIAGRSLRDIRFASMLTLTDENGRWKTVETRVQADDSLIRFHGRNRHRADDAWTMNAEAHLVRGRYRTPAFQPSSPGPAAREIDHDAVYAVLATVGLDYGPAFRPLTKAVLTEDRVWGDLDLPVAAMESPDTVVHPVLLDGGLQMLALLSDGISGTPVPTAIRRLTPYVDRLPARVRAEAWLDGSGQGFLSLYDAEGRVLLEAEGIAFNLLPRVLDDERDRLASLYRQEWVEPDVDPAGLVQNASVPIVFYTPREIEVGEGLAAVLADLTAAAVSRNAGGEGSWLIIVTRNAWRVVEDDPVNDPVQAAFWGLGRTIRREFSDLGVVLIDADVDIDAGEIETLARRMGDGAELAVRGSKTFRLALRPVIVEKSLITALSGEARLPIPAPAGSPFAVSKGTTSRRIKDVRFQMVPRRVPRGRKIEVEIDSAGLNFKDILKILGVLTPQTLEGTHFGASLGMEGCARVTSLGPDAVAEGRFAVGDRLFVGLRQGCLRRHAIVDPDRDFCFPWPVAGMTAHEVAAMPTTFLTAEYALSRLARLRPGETVLIHSGAGGVGHAAIQVARRLGARIFSTAGTPERRAYVKTLGVDRVFDSRSLDFEHEIRAATLTEEGEWGVDVVINALSGDMQDAALRVLARYGRLIELGKADIAADRGLPLAAFQRNLAFHAMDLDRIFVERREWVFELADELKKHFTSGVYHPLPTTVFAADSLPEALSHLAEGKAVGKVVVDLTAPPRRILPGSSYAAGAGLRGTQVVTGGLGGLGLAVAEMLFESGAEAIVLAGRTAPSEAAREVLANMKTRSGPEIRIVQADLGEAADVRNLLSGACAGLPPVRGIIHAAGVLDDRPLETLTVADGFSHVFGGKALGAWNLHQVGQELSLELDHFILFSSISGWLGNPNQGNYASANTFLDGLAQHRRALGLPAVSIAWGAVGQAGMAARDGSLAAIMAARGMNPLPLPDMVEILRAAIMASGEEIGAFRMDWSRWAAAAAPRAVEPAGGLALSARGDRGGPVDWLPASRAEAEDKVLSILCKAFAKVMGLDRDGIDPARSLAEQGMDSLMSVEFQLTVQQELGSNVPLPSSASQLSLRQLAVRLLDVLIPADGEAAS